MSEQPKWLEIMEEHGVFKVKDDKKDKKEGLKDVGQDKS
jgi:hypothetical protein